MAWMGWSDTNFRNSEIVGALLRCISSGLGVTFLSHGSELIESQAYLGEARKMRPVHQAGARGWQSAGPPPLGWVGIYVAAVLEAQANSSSNMWVNTSLRVSPSVHSSDFLALQMSPRPCHPSCFVHNKFPACESERPSALSSCHLWASASTSAKWKWHLALALRRGVKIKRDHLYEVLSTQEVLKKSGHRFQNVLRGAKDHGLV